MDKKTREIITDLSYRFGVNNNFYLDKALNFLKQFQHGAVSRKTKQIRAIDISGVSPKDIHYIRINLRDAFGYQIIDTHEIYTEDKNAEFVYKSTELLDTAIALLEFIKSGKDKKITLKDGSFFYRNELLDIRKGNLRSLLTAIFLITNGQSKLINYKEIKDQLGKVQSFKKKKISDEQLKQLVHKYLTGIGYSYQLDSKMKNIFDGASTPFSSVDAVGIRFVNE
jgi:hypothetical protein